jgi:hypothetical protein
LLDKSQFCSISFEPARFIEQKEFDTMIPQPPEFFDLYSTDHRLLEDVAAAERLRGPGTLRSGAASVLRALADHLSPLPAPPRATSVPAVHSVRPARARCHPAA